jgi:two-component system, LytTR family, response regulator
MRLKVLVVDDEPLAREGLKLLLGRQPLVQSVTDARNGREAIALIRDQRPDLVLLDVQMPGMSGFDVIRKLGVRRSPAVIFVTAYDQYALQAFESHAIDYLLKPFDRRRLRQAIERAARLVGGHEDVARRLQALVSAVDARQGLERIAVKARGRVYFVRVEEIDWIEAQGHYLALHVGSDTHLVRETIGGIEERLDPARFVRVHRSAIVNLDRVKELRPSFHGEYVIELRDGPRVTTGRAYSARLQRLLRP